MREPFPIPDDVLIDVNTGLALNIPAAYQEWPNWWVDQPDRYAALVTARAAAGIDIEDFPNGEVAVQPTYQTIPMGTKR